MSRPLRIEFEGALYHVTSRGNRRESIFADDSDRTSLLEILASTLVRYDGVLLAYCLMGNHYHFVLQTRRANLSLLMRHLNGMYTRRFNERHCKVGHLFQGRFKAILVDREHYLWTLCRYVELNPVRAHVVERAEDWLWSSYRAHTGLTIAPPWLDTDGVHAVVLGRQPCGAEDRSLAGRLYADHVTQETHAPFWDVALRQQIFLGDERFVAIAQAAAEQNRMRSREIPLAQRQSPLTLGEWMATSGSRDEGIRQAHLKGGMSLSSIAKELRLSVSRISRVLSRAKGKT